jgi:hypothetical protein
MFLVSFLQGELWEFGGWFVKEYRHMGNGSLAILKNKVGLFHIFSVSRLWFWNKGT